MKVFRRGFFRHGLRLLAVTGILCCAYATWLYSTNNFHEVLHGELYRSAQPNGRELASYASGHGIRTVINLRGEHVGTGWYDEELKASTDLGLKHIDFSMSSRTELTPKQANDLIRIFETAEKPILIHCKAGADRTGLAAALYLASVGQAGEEAAEAQLSLLYGHFPIPVFSAAYPMDETFEVMEPSLGFPDS